MINIKKTNMRTNKFFIFLVYFSFLLSNKHLSAQTIVEIKIGNQVWFSKNLDVDKFRNGDTIPEVKSSKEWMMAFNSKQPAWCYYENNSENNDKYGKIYNWYAVNDSRGLAPEGWHIPNDSEWKQLIQYLGGGKQAAIKLKNKNGWKNNFCPKNFGNNMSGFSAIPVGNRAEGFDKNVYACWWSSTEKDEKSASYFYLFCNPESELELGQSEKVFGLSVRCLKN